MPNRGYCSCIKDFTSLIIYTVPYLSFVIEIVIIALNYDTQIAYNTVLAVSIILICLSLYGGTRLAYEFTTSRGTTDYSAPYYQEMYNHTITDVRSMAKGSYLLYVLPLPSFINWFYSLIMKNIPVIPAILSWIPFIVWVVGMGIGHTIARNFKHDRQDEYIPI